MATNDTGRPSIGVRLLRGLRALVLLVVAVTVLGGALGAGVGYGIARLVPKSSSPSVVAQQHNPAPQPLVIGTASVIVQDKQHYGAHHNTQAAYDGDPNTAWKTYKLADSYLPKHHRIALVLGLRGPRVVTDVRLDLLARGPHNVVILAADAPRLSGATAVATYTGRAASATVHVPAAQRTRARYWLLEFVTIAPHGQHQYRGGVREVTFDGTA